MKPTLLLIDDDLDFCERLVAELNGVGFDTRFALDGIQGQALAHQLVPDLILLDLLLPKVDGLTLCMRLKRDPRTTAVPLVILTSLRAISDKVSGFNAGADDYVIKPHDSEELIARLRALLRRSQGEALTSLRGEVLTYGPLTLVPERLEAIWFEQAIRLTRLELEVLHCLLQRHGQAVSPEEVLSEVWGYEADVNGIECLRVQIRHLRGKLEPNPHRPSFLKTMYGVGYCLDLPMEQRRYG
ncbi:response regulator transcription factor [Cyanobium sp. Morenito 9A2]|uniref:response regulator transcription factor n=1 Tax=Cyanobium sp. Morenito 9A2 TaxID=2823718 RepID=UPI0020CF0C6A|nr:response regulator transcription factor [Cyanobium sp. Morenito 9A2]MCP9848529.1 response regulator transcription factor [Cyanobium sp. Morenito 9A2]